MKVIKKECGCVFGFVPVGDGTESGIVLRLWGCGPGWVRVEVMYEVDVKLMHIEARETEQRLVFGEVDDKRIGEFFRDLPLEEEWPEEVEA